MTTPNKRLYRGLHEYQVQPQSMQLCGDSDSLIPADSVFKEPVLCLYHQNVIVAI